jgi:hypothetical protein
MKSSSKTKYRNLRRKISSATTFLEGIQLIFSSQNKTIK